MNNVSSLANVFNRSPSTFNDPVSYRGGTIRNNYYGRDIMSSIISRIALDASMCDFKHFKVNPENGNQIPITSTMLDLMTVQANIDQTGRAFQYDLVWSMLDDGYIAVVPTLKTNGEIRTLRVFKLDELDGAIPQQFALDIAEPSKKIWETACGKGYRECQLGEPAEISLRLSPIALSS